jgi:hypothetical protein
MPIPKPNQDEKTKDFIARCMGNETMVKDYKDNGQRYAICISQTKKAKSESSILEDVLEALQMILEQEEGFVEEPGDVFDWVIPMDEDYVDDFDDNEEIETFEFSTYKFEDPMTNEVYYYNRMGNWKKDGRSLIYKGKGSEYQGRKVQLNKPFRTPDGPKKFSVYVKNDKGNVVKVNFGDPNLSIKRDDPKRRKSFRARHKCDQQKDKTTPAYWSCYQWRSNSPVQD